MPSRAALPEVHVPQCRTLQSTDLPRPQSRSDSAQIRAEQSRADRNRESLKEAVHTLKARVLSDTLWRQRHQWHHHYITMFSVLLVPLVPSPKLTADLPGGQRCPVERVELSSVSSRSFLNVYYVYRCDVSLLQNLLRKVTNGASNGCIPWSRKGNRSPLHALRK